MRLGAWLLTLRRTACCLVAGLLLLIAPFLPWRGSPGRAVAALGVAAAMEHLLGVACRSVGHLAQPGAPDDASRAARIHVATPDGRLVARDARRGTPCPGFGEGGTADLTAGMGLREAGSASNTSGPTVAGGLVIDGQQVGEDRRRDAPSGVVRADHAATGAFRRASDARWLDRPQQQPGSGGIRPRGTPNVCNVVTADVEPGLASASAPPVTSIAAIAGVLVYVSIAAALPT